MDENDRNYSNGEITVFWKPKKCIHATICYTQLNEVFNPRKRPWVDMSGATTDKIIDMVNRCPTDALTYRYNKDLEGQISEGIKDLPKVEEKPVEIQIMKDGPIVVTGKIKLTDKEGKELIV